MLRFRQLWRKRTDQQSWSEKGELENQTIVCFVRWGEKKESTHEKEQCALVPCVGGSFSHLTWTRMARRVFKPLQLAVADDCSMP